MALGMALQQAQERHPNERALIVGERSWTYAELDEVTDKLGAALMRCGVQPGDRVALHFTNGPELVFCYYACFKIGAVAVPLNVRLKGPEIEYVVNHCGARLFLGQSDLFAEVQPVRSKLPAVKEYYIAGDCTALADVRPLDELTVQSTGEIEFPEVADDAVAAILYTSGTTSRPKGVTHTHRTLERMVASYLEYAELRSEHVVAIFLSMGHIFAFGFYLLPGVSAGATLLVIPRFDPESVLGALEKHRVTHFGALPVMYNALVNCAGASSYDLRALQLCIAGGDAAPTELQRRFTETFGAEITEGSGMTEVLPYAMNPAFGAKRMGSIGTPAVGATLRLVDEMGLDVPQGEVGEILVKSEAAMVGYWNDPVATAAALEDGWLRTGDLARVDEDGYYWFVGRKKEIIVRGGSNISPLEVEEALYEHPAVKEAGVVGTPHESLGETVAAYVALKDGNEVSAEELRQFLHERIAAYKVPEAITFLPELPKGLTGKIHRKTLKEWASEVTARAAPDRPAPTDPA